MNIPELWTAAARDSRDCAILLSDFSTMQPDELRPVALKALKRARSTAAALESLTNRLNGSPEPKRGE